MIKLFLSMIIVTLFNVNSSSADDNMKPVFDRVDDLLTRVESGVSLNSYAESLAEFKIEYKKALENESNIDNPLLSDRMKEVMGLLDEYARLWKMQDIDHFRYSKSGDNRCYVQLTRQADGYDIACQKEIILSKLKPIVERTKSAHYNGW